MGRMGRMVHFFVLSSTRARLDSRVVRRRAMGSVRCSAALSNSPLTVSSFSVRLRNRASILSRSVPSSWWNSVLVTCSGSTGDLRRKSFLASTAIEATAAAESSQVSIPPLGGDGIWERVNIEVRGQGSAGSGILEPRRHRERREGQETGTGNLLNHGFHGSHGWGFEQKLTKETKEPENVGPSLLY